MTTRSQLLGAVQRWLRRTTDTELQADLGTILGNVEARIAREILHSSQVTVTVLEITGRSAPLPTNCLEVRSLTLTGSLCRRMDYVTPEVLREGRLWESGGTPAQYTIENRDVYIAPAASTETPAVFDLSYYARFSPMIDDADTTPLLTDYFDLYLYAMLSETCKFIQDEALGMQFEMNYVDIRRTLHAQDMSYQMSGSVARRIGTSRRV